MWNGYPVWFLEGVNTPPPDQPAEGLEENSLDPVPNQAGPSTLTEIIVVESPVLDKTKMRYPVGIPYMKGVSEQSRGVVKGYIVKCTLSPVICLDRYCGQKTR